MKARPTMRPGRLLPLTLLLSFVLQAVVWFFPAQAASASDLLGKLHLPVEQEWVRGQSVSSQIAYAFGDLMLVVGFCQTWWSAVSKVNHPRLARRQNRNRQIAGLSGGAAMLVGLNLGLRMEMAAGVINADKTSLIQIFAPIFDLGAGILLASALLTCGLPPRADTS